MYSLAISATFDDDVGEQDGYDPFSGPIDYTSDADRVVSFSQRHVALTDVFAPGHERHRQRHERFSLREAFSDDLAAALDEYYGMG